jgi:hypothetical protein
MIEEPSRRLADKTFIAAMHEAAHGLAAVTRGRDYRVTSLEIPGGWRWVVLAPDATRPVRSGERDPDPIGWLRRRRRLPGG